jgi:hypothetical protein
MKAVAGQGDQLQGILAHVRGLFGARTSIDYTRMPGKKGRLPISRLTVEAVGHALQNANVPNDGGTA